MGAAGDRLDRRLVIVSSEILAAAAFVGLAFARGPLALVVLVSAGGSATFLINAGSFVISALLVLR
jgi:hypothetical protein